MYLGISFIILCCRKTFRFEKSTSVYVNWRQTKDLKQRYYEYCELIIKDVLLLFPYLLARPRTLAPIAPLGGGRSRLRPWSLCASGWSLPTSAWRDFYLSRLITFKPYKCAELADNTNLGILIVRIVIIGDFRKVDCDSEVVVWRGVDWEVLVLTRMDGPTWRPRLSSVRALRVTSILRIVIGLGGVD